MPKQLKFVQNSRRSFKEYELAILKYWLDNKIFEKSVDQRSPAKSYVFYDGPPFITGYPHVGTLLSSIVKDVIPRYMTMQGYRVERTWGWDCHGLPAEVFTEKKLAIKDKRDIGTKISLEDYILTCRENMIQTGSEWEDTISRIGRWVNFKGAYKTMDKDYMESVWWAFKTLYDKGKIYQGEKVLLYCVRDATPLSKAEINEGNGFKEVTDVSVYVKFELLNGLGSLLAWTTTPWTLPANTAVAVNKDYDYAIVDYQGQRLIILKSLVSSVMTNDQHQPLDYKIVDEIKGQELIGLKYKPLFEDRGQNAHQVWQADYVSSNEGTGIVHLAPAYGEEDYALAKANNIPIVSNLDDYGVFKEGPWQGQNVWDANKQIAKDLHNLGVVFKLEYFKHQYPHCHRCGNKLIYRAHPSWFMNIAGQKDLMLAENQTINWFPKHIKEGRFKKNIETAPDWNLSRDRFWATAMPVWVCDHPNCQKHIKVIGNYQELYDYSGVKLEDYHRPWVDDITFELAGVKYRRIDKVLDCWFESGSMPFAQFHYPFENKDKFESTFPGDFISEYVGQTRAWFYYLHTVSVGLFDKKAFSNVIVTGTLAGNDGRKMSKSYGNYTDPMILMNSYSADALRLLLLGSPVLNAEDYALIDKNVADVARKLNMIWNVYDFFTLYADVDNWQVDDSFLEANKKPELDNILDNWILVRLNQLQVGISKFMAEYDIPNAVNPIYSFIDDLSNWYVRRSRKRFWKSENDQDKNQAYLTLYTVLVRLSILLAPFVPFLSEELYRQLTNKKSVHLEDWPADQAVDETVIAKMIFAREVINQGLKQRALSQLKVRQPLYTATVYDQHNLLNEQLKQIIQEELNVKEVVSYLDKQEYQKATAILDDLDIVKLDVNVSPELYSEGLARELIRNIQALRKQAKLSVDDRIYLSINSKDELIEQVMANKDLQTIIISETLTAKIVNKQLEFKQDINIDGRSATLSLEKKG